MSRIITAYHVDFLSFPFDNFVKKKKCVYLKLTFVSIYTILASIVINS